MSSSAITQIGIDVAKDTLEFSGPCAGSSASVQNQSRAVVRHLKKLQQLYPQLHLFCEPTGGYQRLLVATAHALQIPITVVDAWKVRHYAMGLGWLEKSDPIDAQVLRQYGQTSGAAPTPPSEPVHDVLRDWVQLRDRYVQRLSEEQTFLQSIRNPDVQAQVRQECDHLKAQIAELEARIDRFLQEQAPAWNHKVQTLCLIKGMGFRLATSILAYLPELGTLRDQAIAKLVGLAPIVDDSGKKAGNRHIARGRAVVRRLFFISAIIAAKHNEHLRPIYQRLRSKGKPAKVALIAIARKLLLFFNSLLKPALLTPV